MVAGERIAILFPSLTFLILFIIKIILESSLPQELLREKIITNTEDYEQVHRKYALLNIFIDGLIIFLTNGISIMFILHHVTTGFIFLFIGILISLIGIICTITENINRTNTITFITKLNNHMVDLSIMFNNGELAFLGVFGYRVLFHLNRNINPEVDALATAMLAFLTMMILTYLLIRKLPE